MNMTSFPGWHLLGQFPLGDPDGVGSWLLHHEGQALLLEAPPGLTPDVVRQGLQRLQATLLFLTASHDHEDHLDAEVWQALRQAFPQALPLRNLQEPSTFFLGWEPVYLLPAPKHSPTDQVTVFRGVAMTGDIELGQLASVNDEVPDRQKRRSMRRLRRFPRRTGYRVHSVVSAHLNDCRTDVHWPDLFLCRD
jgi:hydroxyacylglutathione hydrolase